jgi:hypothetical protein
VNGARPSFGLPRSAAAAGPGAGTGGRGTGEASAPRRDDVPVPDDQPVDLAGERARSGVDEVLDALDADLIGLTPVKTRIREIAALLLVDRARARFGLSAQPPSLHMSFTYYLYRAENERDYGSESIEILLQYMENHRSDLVVILAGYADRMDSFFASNPGMSSRIAHHLEFPDYTLEELTEIAYLMLANQRYHLSAKAAPVFQDYLTRRMAQPRFANARSVRNALERARLRQASRLVAASGTLTKDDLMRLDPADFLASRVFSDQSPQLPGVTS